MGKLPLEEPIFLSVRKTLRECNADPMFINPSLFIAGCSPPKSGLIPTTKLRQTHTPIEKLGFIKIWGQHDSSFLLFDPLQISKHSLEPTTLALRVLEFTGIYVESTPFPSKCDDSPLNPAPFLL